MLYATDRFQQKATVDEDLNVVGEEPLATWIRGALLGFDPETFHAGSRLEVVAAKLKEIEVDSELDEDSKTGTDIAEEALF